MAVSTYTPRSPTLESYPTIYRQRKQEVVEMQGWLTIWKGQNFIVNSSCSAGIINFLIIRG